MPGGSSSLARKNEGAGGRCGVQGTESGFLVSPPPGPPKFRRRHRFPLDAQLAARTTSGRPRPRARPPRGTRAPRRDVRRHRLSFDPRQPLPVLRAAHSHHVPPRLVFPFGCHTAGSVPRGTPVTSGTGEGTTPNLHAATVLLLLPLVTYRTVRYRLAYEQAGQSPVPPLSRSPTFASRRTSSGLARKRSGRASKLGPPARAFRSRPGTSIRASAA